MHTIKIYAIALAWKEKFFLRRRVEVQIQLFPSPICSDASSARRAHCLYRRIHTWPIIQRIENVVHLGRQASVGSDSRTSRGTRKHDEAS